MAEYLGLVRDEHVVESKSDLLIQALHGLCVWHLLTGMGD